MRSHAFQAILDLLDEITEDERTNLARRLEPMRRRTPVDEALAAVCASLGTSPDAVRGRARDRETVGLRFSVCVALYRRGYSSTEIGRAIGRDHTTVLYALDTSAGRRRRRTGAASHGDSNLRRQA